MPIAACLSAIDACPSAIDACPSAANVCPSAIDVYLLPIDVCPSAIDVFLLPIDVCPLPIDVYLLTIDVYLWTIDAYLTALAVYAVALVAKCAVMAAVHNAPDISVAAMEVTARWDEIDASAEVSSLVAGVAGDNALHFLGARSVVFCGRTAIAPRGCVADVRATLMRRGQIDGEFRR